MIKWNPFRNRIKRAYQAGYERAQQDNNHLPKVNRVEVIDGDGRSYTNYDAHSVVLSIQDNGCTLKVFIGH